VTVRPILNELNVIVAEGAEKTRKRLPIQAKSWQECCLLLGGNPVAFNAELRDPGRQFVELGKQYSTLNLTLIGVQRVAGWT